VADHRTPGPERVPVVAWSSGSPLKSGHNAEALIIVPFVCRPGRRPRPSARMANA